MSIKKLLSLRPEEKEEEEKRGKLPHRPAATKLSIDLFVKVTWRLPAQKLEIALKVIRYQLLKNLDRILG